jgi:hypothetical protein
LGSHAFSAHIMNMQLRFPVLKWKALGPIILVTIGVLNVGAGFFGHDQIENILGGQSILHGGRLYIDFFTQHAPFPYLVSAGLLVFVLGKALWLPVLFNGLLVFWALWVRRVLRPVLGSIFSWIIAGSLLLALPYVGGQTILDETFVALGSCTFIILGFTRWSRAAKPLSIRDAIFAAFVLAMVALSSYAYIPFAFAGAIWFLYQYVYIAGANRRWRQLAIGAGVLLTPYVLVLGWLAIIGALRAFFFDTYQFNKDFYSLFINFPKTIIGWVVAGPMNALHFFWGTISHIQPLSILAFSTSFAVIAVIVIQFRTRQIARGVLLVIALSFLLVRSGNVDDFISGGNVAHNHAASFTLFALLCAGVLLPTLFKVKSKLSWWNNVWCIGAVLFLALPLSLFGFFTLWSNIIVAQYDILRHEPPLACVVNKLTTPNDFVWFGPHAFAESLFTHARPATRYPYFFPLHAACPQCKAQLLSDLQSTNPAVLVYNKNYGIFGQTATIYLKEVGVLLAERYEKVDGPLMNLVYIRKDLMPKVNSAITACGFNVSP